MNRGSWTVTLSQETKYEAVLLGFPLCMAGTIGITPCEPHGAAGVFCIAANETHGAALQTTTRVAGKEGETLGLKWDPKRGVVLYYDYTLFPPPPSKEGRKYKIAITTNSPEESQHTVQLERTHSYCTPLDFINYTDPHIVVVTSIDPDGPSGIFNLVKGSVFRSGGSRGKDVSDITIRGFDDQQGMYTLYFRDPESAKRGTLENYHFNVRIL